MFGQDRNPQGADFVGRVTVCGDAISADKDNLYFSFFHGRCGHVVTEDRRINARIEQFEGCEACAL